MGPIRDRVAHGGDYETPLPRYLDKEIESIVCDDQLILRFTNGAVLSLSDQGQSCCEHRYLHTDDDLSVFTGARLRDVELREIGRVADANADAHEQTFLIVTTTKGVFTVCAHNVHNGYYGGIEITQRELRSGL
jgi:hypothetical protein